MKHALTFHTARRVALLSLVVAAPAAAQSIVVDGNDNDWSSVVACVDDPANDGSSGVNLARNCFFDTNTSGSNGSLYVLFQSHGNLRTNIDTWFGFVVDTNQDGVINSSDEAYAFYYPRRTGDRPDSLWVVDPVTLQLRRYYPFTSQCGGSGANNGWEGYRDGKVVELRVAYGCLGLSAGNDNRLVQAGVYPALDLGTQGYYDGATGTFALPGPAPEVNNFVAISGNRSARLVWTNPAAHDGVLVLRAVNATPNVAPSAHASYSVGQTLGNAQVVYVDSGGSSASKFTDTGLTNGTRYVYKIYNHHQNRTYSGGAVPTTSGVSAYPTSQQAGSAKWCYTVGVPSLQQPVTEAGGGIFTSSNGGAVTANLTLNGSGQDGDERWRPVQLNGAVQSRSPNLPLHGRTGTYLLTGDQAGYAYAIHAQTGNVTWTGNNGNPLGDRIQAPASTQLRAYADAAFQAANPSRDLVFFATRNSDSRNNKVYALSSANGQVVWTYAPGNLDIISGGMLVDYTHNRLWVAARSRSGAQSSVRVLSTLDGSLVGQLWLGDIDQSVIRDAKSNLALIVNNAGTAYGVNLDTMTQVWSHSVGTTSSYLFPTGNGFIASVRSGSVRRYAFSGSTVTQLWSTSLTGPTGITLDYATQKVFVGSSNGRIYQLDVATGANEKNLVVSSQAVGMPTLDATSGRLHVGTLDGRVCAFGLPLP